MSLSTWLDVFVLIIFEPILGGFLRFWTNPVIQDGGPSSLFDENLTKYDTFGVGRDNKFIVWLLGRRPDKLTVEDLKEFRYMECVLKVVLFTYMTYLTGLSCSRTG